jgi:glycosyltransferase involved in cell wall biosynthesis
MRYRVGRIIESFRPDVIHSHSMVGFAVDSWKEATRRGVPVVHTLHDFSLFCRNSNAFRQGRICEGVCLACRVTELKRLYSRELSAVIGVSRDILQRHVELGFFNNIPAELRAVIHNMPSIAPRQRSQRPLDTPFTICFIGRILPEKGLESLLDALANLPIGRWRLLIAGDVFPPLDLKTLQARVAGLPVEWLGFIRAEEFYPQLDVLVVPSIWAEPSPLVIYEAFANAVPVVGAKIGGITDLVEDNVTGWLYPAGNVAALSKLLAERIRAGRDLIPREDAFDCFKSESTSQYVAKRYEAIYGKAIQAFHART